MFPFSDVCVCVHVVFILSSMTEREHTHRTNMQRQQQQQQHKFIVNWKYNKVLIAVRLSVGKLFCNRYNDTTSEWGKGCAVAFALRPSV